MEQDICSICLDVNVEPESICSSKKCRLCRKCRIDYEKHESLRDSCPTCRGKMLPLIDISSIPYTNIFNKMHKYMNLFVCGKVQTF